MEFTEALKSNVIYVWNGRVHVGDTLRAVETNFGRGGMKRIIEEAAAHHAEAIHYSASAGMRVGGSEDQRTKDFGFWPLVLEGLFGVRLKREEADRAK